MKKLITTITSLLIASAMLTSCNTNTAKTDSDNTTSDFDFDRTISVVSRESGSGTRGAFIELLGIEEKDGDGNTVDKTTDEAIISNSTDIVMKQVQGDAYAVGYISLGSLNDTVKALTVDDASATAENVKNGSYAVSRPFNIATKDDSNVIAQDLISFILSKEGQEIVETSYIPLDTDYSFESTNPSGKLVIAGSTSVSPLMEKLTETYNEINPNVEFEIQSNGSSAGISATISGTADIGMASRQLKDSEKEEVTGIVIALDGIAVIVNNENPIDNLTADDIKSIYVGDVTKWNAFN